MSNIIIANKKIAHNITPKSYIKQLKNKIDESKTISKSSPKSEPNMPFSTYARDESENETSFFSFI